METKHEYITESADVAAFLVVRRFQLLRGVCGANDMVSFIFEDDGAAEQAVTEFYSGGQVPAHEFAGAARRIKDLIWNFRKRQNTERKNEQRPQQ